MKRKRRDGPSETNNLFALRCSECGHCLIRTSTMYLACPNGHGRLVESVPDEPSGRWFDDEPTLFPED